MWQLFDIKYELAWTSDEKGILNNYVIDLWVKNASYNLNEES